LRQKLIFIVLIFSCKLSFAQDTSKPWFPDGDEGFYGYLADRFMGLGHDKPMVNRNGENVIFEFWVTDSGWIDSVKILQCFQSNISLQLRIILNTMPRVNAAVKNGKTVAEHRVYNLVLKPYIDGYRFEPNMYTTATTSRTTSSGFKISIVVIAVAAMLIVVFK
jgi:hypothetical protein